jgi:hypothetical protein
MKTIKNILIATLATVTLSLASCEGLLDNEQHGVTTPETFYETDEQAEQALSAIYSGYYGTFAGTLYLLKNLLSDDFWGGGRFNDNADVDRFNEFTFSAEHPYLIQAFEGLYSVIYRANLILENVPDESAVQKQARAEARVFRALAYIDLISMWGTPPLVDHVLAPSEYQQPNGDPAALWGLVESDLSEAINSGALYEKAGVNSNSSYHASKHFAQALLGKALVFQGKYAEAITPLDAVINSQKYELLPANQYENILQYMQDNSSESVFELNKLNDPNNAFLNFEMTTAMTGWRSDKMTFPADHSQDYLNNGTWGMCSPQKVLYDAFEQEEGANGSRLKQSIITFDRLQALGIGLTADYYGNEGYFMWKTRKVADEFISGGWMSSHNNTRVMRYSEVLLLAAEAHVQGGGSQATNYLNIVRTRAGLSNKTATMDAIILEKRLELCGENVRFQDMLRWGIAEELLRNQGEQTPFLQPNGTIRWESYNTAGVAGFKERHWLLPFPQTELTNNPNITQNDGWGAQK